jgi:glycosyltransferase involved in cell wall biosynthesis
VNRAARHIALQFGHIRHFHEGLTEYSQRLAGEIARRAERLRAERNWHFHFILERRWHGYFGPQVHYLPITQRLRWPHWSSPAFDLWHGLHQHMRFRPPRNAAIRLITMHDFNYLTERHGWRRWRHERRLWRQLRTADELIAISELVAADARRVLPWPLPVRVIHNGVADLSASPQSPPGEPEPDGFLLHISRMSPSKNVGALLRLAAAWPAQRLVLAGPAGPCVEQHRAQCRAAGLSNVRILTDISEAQKAWLYAHCGGFVFPSLVEGFGLPPLEAMYFGKPVFVSRLSSLPEVCGAAAVYFDDFDPAAMRARIEPNLRPDAARSGEIRAHAQRYAWSTAAERYLAAYAELLDGDAPVPAPVAGEGFTRS